MSFKYLHAVGDGSFWLDHRLIPEVSAMFCAMASRAPVGGIQARYAQVVDAVAESLFDDWDGLLGKLGGASFRLPSTWAEAKAAPLDQEGQPPSRPGVTVADYHRELAEDRLCTYPLHPRVQKFFDDFVGRYGHSSIMELSGQPAVYSEGISWFTAWQLFDSPLCAGQEFSTRAVQHANWPMARECFNGRYDPDFVYDDEAVHFEEGGLAIHAEPEDKGFLYTYGNLDLQHLHQDWFEIFEAEVAWWKEHLAVEANRVALGIGDKEPFRPALDRARWALPGTIATGCAHTTSLRERARVLKDGANLASASGAVAAKAVWDEIADTYREALPGLAGMGLREAVYTPETVIPGHMLGVFSATFDGPDAEVTVVSTDGLRDVVPFKRKGEKSYLDVAANATHRVNVSFRCSLAVARDWHRHRTLFPWHLQVVRDRAETDVIRIGHDVASCPILIDHHYAPMSDLAKAKLPELLLRSTAVFDAFMAKDNVVQAALALPFGTRVRMSGQGGLRDVVYMLELRKFAHGANFEYKDQADQALTLLSAHLDLATRASHNI